MKKSKPWHQKWLPFALLDLNNMRAKMRQDNLIDTEKFPNNGTKIETDSGVDGQERRFRSYDGSFNDPRHPQMGKIFTRLGRNVNTPVDPLLEQNMLHPSPREISRKLLTRDELIPAEQLNLLAASWIQFMQHGWFSHFPDRDLGLPVCKLDPEEIILVDLEKDDPWPNAHTPLKGEWKDELTCQYQGEGKMKVNRTPKDPTRPFNESDEDYPPTYLNHVSHWWDGSQLYGSTQKVCKRLRTGVNGKMKINEQDRLNYYESGGLKDLPDCGFVDNWWVGLGLLYVLFIKEHNSICDAVKSHHPEMDDEELFQIARLVNSALMAKIHTVEWTTGLLATDVLDVAMHANWKGLKNDKRKLISEFVTNILRCQSLLSKNEKSRFREAIDGILDTEIDHHAADYSLTEEFSSVYRLHGLILDYHSIRSRKDNEELAEKNLFEVSGRRAREVLESFDINDLLYSFGTLHPGALRLHNYPVFLQNLYRDNGEIIDLGTIDILRDRERGVVRYNEFREKIGMERLTDFSQLSDNSQWVEELREVYENDLELVDLFVGMYSEPLIPGFAISETAFRIFVLMASRRLKSDYFFTEGYNADNYTQTGIDWVESTTMRDIILRHYPELGASLEGVPNAFSPWNKA